MAAPAVMDQLTVRFRDCKGQTGRLKVRIGGADHAATVTALNTLVTRLALVSNCAVQSGLDPRGLFTYGTNAEFPTVEDGAFLTFRDPDSGTLHRYKIPAPILAKVFDTDGETAKPTNTESANGITAVTTSVYSDDNAVNPLVVAGGIRRRSKVIRRVNGVTLNPQLTSG